MNIVKFPIAFMVAFLWIGFVCAISFMEAWLKFKAPGITVPLGLGIGRLVFGALNKVEWVLASVIAANVLFSSHQLRLNQWIILGVPVAILLIQSVWLLPVLDARAELHIQGKTVPKSNLHVYYVGFELLKIICLGFFGAGLFQFKQ